MKVGSKFLMTLTVMISVSITLAQMLGIFAGCASLAVSLFLSFVGSAEYGDRPDFLARVIHGSVYSVAGVTIACTVFGVLIANSFGENPSFSFFGVLLCFINIGICCSFWVLVAVVLVSSRWSPLYSLFIKRLFKSQ